MLSFEVSRDSYGACPSHAFLSEQLVFIGYGFCYLQFIESVDLVYPSWNKFAQAESCTSAQLCYCLSSANTLCANFWVRCSNCHTSFKQETCIYSVNSSFWKQIFGASKASSSVHLTAPLRVKYPSKKRILQCCSNIPLYIFKTFSNHSAGCGFVGKENYAV